MAATSRGAAAIVAGLVLLVGGFLVYHALPALREVGVARFLSDRSWNPTPGPEGQFNLLPAIVGSALATAIATMIAVPVGVGAALGATFLVRPWVGRTTDALVGVLAGLPSVVIGLWGLTALVPLIAALRSPGASLLAAALTLAVMIVPTVYVTSTAALKSVPQAMLDGATAMGMSRWGTIRATVIPIVMPALTVGAVLAVTRALGETMAVVMVAGNVASIPHSILDPVRTLTANIALELPYATGLHRSALFAGGAALMLLSWILVLVSRRLPTVFRGARHG